MRTNGHDDPDFGRRYLPRVPMPPSAPQPQRPGVRGLTIATVLVSLGTAGYLAGLVMGWWH